jgi:hypothetical protein
MDDLYDMNFQSNDEFCKIRIRYNRINHFSMVDHLRRWSTVALAYIYIYIYIYENSQVRIIFK